jgi:hypothetical protein
MFNRENAVGIILLGACAVVAGIMIYAIVTGQRITFSAPAYVTVPLTIVFIGLVLFGLFRNMRGTGAGRGRAWPNPQTGTRSLWDRIRGRRD